MSIFGTRNNISEQFYFHASAAELRQIFSCRFGFIIGQSMRVHEGCFIHLQFFSLCIHISNKICLPFLRITCMIDLSSAPEGQLISGIIATRQHQAIEQLLYRIYLSLDEFSRSSSYLIHIFTRNHALALNIDLIFLDDPVGNIKGHYFGETSNLQTDTRPILQYNFISGILNNDKALGFDMLQFLHIISQNRELLILCQLLNQAFLGFMHTFISKFIQFMQIVIFEL